MTTTAQTTKPQAAAMSEAEAKRITSQIKAQAKTAKGHLAKLFALVDQAKAGQAWLRTGHKGWTAYLADVLGTDPLDLGTDDRRAVIAYLAGQGMSSRAIGQATGTPHRTAARIAAKATRANGGPAMVTSLDGRERPAQATTQPKRPALCDELPTMTRRVGNIVGVSVAKVTTDDRYKGAAKRKADETLRAELDKVIAELQSIRDGIGKEAPKASKATKPTTKPVTAKAA